MQIEASSNIGKPLIAVKTVFGECPADGKAEISLSKRETPIIEYGMLVQEAIENSESAVLVAVVRSLS